MNKIVKLVLIGTGIYVATKYFSDFRKRSETYKVVGSGKFSHAEIHSDQNNLGNNVSFPQRTTIVHMEDGSRFLVSGMIDLPFAKGSEVKVEENDFGHRRIVKVLTPESVA